MRDGIAIIMAVLGTVLVLSGAAALWATALVKARGPVEETEGESGVARTLEVAGRLPSPDRLIIWGIVLLALSAVAVGAITFGASASTVR